MYGPLCISIYIISTSYLHQAISVWQNVARLSCFWVEALDPKFFAPAAPHNGAKASTSVSIEFRCCPHHSVLARQSHLHFLRSDRYLPSFFFSLSLSFPRSLSHTFSHVVAHTLSLSLAPLLSLSLHSLADSPASRWSKLRQRATTNPERIGRKLCGHSLLPSRTGSMQRFKLEAFLVVECLRAQKNIRM